MNDLAQLRRILSFIDGNALPVYGETEKVDD